MDPSAPPSLDRLPGAELIEAGLNDLASGKESIGSLLIEIASARLKRAGLQVPDIPANEVDAELRLYRLLGEEHGVNGYSQYNAYLRRLSSFCRALESRISASLA